MKQLITLFLISFMLISCKEQVEPLEDSNSNATTSQVKSNSSLKETITRAYTIKDSAGKKVKDTVRMMQAISFRPDGKEHSNIYYNLDGTKAWEDLYQYNADGHKSGSKYFENGNHMITYKYELDAQGRRIAYTAYEALTATPLYKGYSTYNEDGTVRKDGNKNKVGVIEWNYEYLFDSQGEDLGYVYIDPNTGERFPSSYKITKRNADGAWTERSIMQNDSVQAIETREFIYN